MNGSPIPQFFLDRSHQVVYWNKALEEISGIKAVEVLGTKQHWRAFYDYARSCLADLLLDGEITSIPKFYSGKYRKSKLVKDAYEVTDYFPSLGTKGRWLLFYSGCATGLQGECNRGDRNT